MLKRLELIFRFPVRLVIENTFDGKLIGLVLRKPLIKNKKPVFWVDDISGMLKQFDDTNN